MKIWQQHSSSWPQGGTQVLTCRSAQKTQPVLDDIARLSAGKAKKPNG